MQMLVAHRVSVTLAAGALPDAGLTRYRRAEVVTVDRAGLEGVHGGTIASFATSSTGCWSPQQDPKRDPRCPVDLDAIVRNRRHPAGSPR